MECLLVWMPSMLLLPFSLLQTDRNKSDNCEGASIDLEVSREQILGLAALG